MSNSDKQIFCPLLSHNISRLICEDVSTVAEGMQPERFAPEEFRKVSNYKEICNDCKFHPE